MQYAPMPSESKDQNIDISHTAWYGAGPEHSPDSESCTGSPNVNFLEPNFQTLEPNQNEGPNDAVKRRRQQNRNSQTAYRQRTKKLIEDLRQEVTEYSEYSQDMYQTLQSLRETTRALVSTIDHALSMQPPRGYRYMERQRTDFTETRRSSRSSEAGQGYSEKMAPDG
jgi:bZIP transcription factor